MDCEPRMALLRGTVAALDRKVDEGFREMRAEQLQLRRDFEKLIYWVAGLTVTNVLTIVGLTLKIAGLF